jgi:predicted NAD/FAD-binding protein
MSVPVKEGPSGDKKKKDKSIDVDVGFMVMNDPNYPNLTSWFRHLGVETMDSDMSLSVSLDEGKTEWSSEGAFRGLGPVAFYRLARDLKRFHAEAADLLRLEETDPRRHLTTLEYLQQKAYSTEFCSYYLLPMMAALWSASLDDVLRFPAAQLVGFLCNHRMLQVFDRPLWKTVKGRSQVYVSAVQKAIEQSGGAKVVLNAAVTEVRRQPPGSRYRYQVVSTGHIDSFDQVVFACHPPSARRMLETGDIRDGWTGLLDEVVYAENVLYLHSDPRLMPTRKESWASWNCVGKSQELSLVSSKRGEAMEGAESGFGARVSSNHGNGVTTGDDAVLEGSEGRMKAVYVTYWLNKLQSLETDENVFVSLNPHQPPDPALTHQRFIMAHPQFQLRTLLAREKLKMPMDEGLWFCGAWQGYGFHEDGCRAGFEVATALSGISLPWATEASLPVLPPPDLARIPSPSTAFSRFCRWLGHDLPVALCQRWLVYFLQHAVTAGKLRIQMQDQMCEFGDGSPCGSDDQPVTIRVYDPWFFVKVVLEYDLGLARSYMAGHFVVEPIDKSKYHPTLRPECSRDETTIALGDPIGLTRLFLLLIGNRDQHHTPRKAGQGHWYSNALGNASGLILAKIGSLVNFLWYKVMMDNSERGGSLKNIRT